MTTRKELVEALRERYRIAAFGERIKILDEFVALTGYHRKHAIRVLREEVVTAKAAHTRTSAILMGARSRRWPARRRARARRPRPAGRWPRALAPAHA
ncbi:MAG: hypothetical protein KGK18_09120, partial [Burkholderiales bacterium]|nr:hypothetical protein [Burkholderiales bacterium]